MKLLFDENLSPHLVALLVNAYAGSVRVREAGLAASSDDCVWQYAIEHECAIVSKDSDFHQRSLLEGFPPKIVWLRRGNCSTFEIAKMLSARQSVVEAFLEDGAASFLVIE